MQCTIVLFNNFKEAIQDEACKNRGGILARHSVSSKCAVSMLRGSNCNVQDLDNSIFNVEPNDNELRNPWGRVKVKCPRVDLRKRGEIPSNPERHANIIQVVQQPRLSWLFALYPRLLLHLKALLLNNPLKANMAAARNERKPYSVSFFTASYISDPKKRHSSDPHLVPKAQVANGFTTGHLVSQL